MVLNDFKLTKESSCLRFFHTVVISTEFSSYLVRNQKGIKKSKVHLGPDYMANFSPASETNPPKIKLSITRSFFQPGLKTGLAPRAEKISCNRKEISVRAEKQEIIWLPDSPDTLRAKFHIWCRD